MSKRHTQKINGTEYVYENVPVWDEDGKRTTYRRRYIGKMVEGQFVPNATYRLEQSLAEAQTVPADDAFGSTVKARACGATEFIELLARRLGADADLEECFPESWKTLLSLAYYMAIEFDSPFNRYHRWAFTHEHPCQRDMSDEDLIDLQKSIRPEAVEAFLRRQVSRRTSSEYTLYSFPTLTSFRQGAYLVINGHGADTLPVSTVMTLYDRTGLPVAYDTAPELVTDVERLLALPRRLGVPETARITVVAGQQFFSRASVDRLLEERGRFVLNPGNGFEYLSNQYGRLPLPKEEPGAWTWSEPLRVYTRTVRVAWRSLASDRRPARVWIHCYYDPGCEGASGPEDEARRHVPSRLGDYNDEKITYYHTFAGGLPSEYGVRLLPDEFVYAPVTQGGLSILVTNAFPEAFDAVNAYRRKDFQYDLFSNLSERMYLRPFSYCGSEPERIRAAQNFLQYLGLLFFDATRKEHSRSGLYAEMFHTSLLDELDLVKRFVQPRRGAKVSTLTAWQKHVYMKLGIKPPGTR